MPSSVTTSVCPCDSPAVRNLSIPAQFYTEETAISDARRGDRRAVPSRAFACITCRMTRVHRDRYVVDHGSRARELATGEAVPLDAIGDEDEPCSEQDLAALTELLEQG